MVQESWSDSLSVSKVHRVGNGRFVEVPSASIAPKAALPREERWKQLGDWFKHGLVRKDWNHASIRKVPNAESSGEAGGYLVPTGLVVGVEAVLHEDSFFHCSACYQPMLAPTMMYPLVDPVQGASGLSPLIGGFTMRWTPESTAPAVSNPVFAMTQLVAHSLGGLGYASRQLVDDGGVPLGAYLETIFARAACFFTTLACFNGTGVNQPLGVISGPGTVEVARNTALDIIEVDVESMLQKLLPACYPHAVWACSGAAYGRLTSISGYNPVSLGWPNGLFRGIPIHVTECLPTLGTRGDLVLFDPRLYVLGERLGLEIAYAEEESTAFGTYQIAFRVWVRLDGQPLWRSTATLANGETGASPYVVLATKLS